MDKKIVYIKDVKYRGKASKIKWKSIEKELKKLIGKSIVIDETKNEVFIGSDFPDEFTSSKYTSLLIGSYKKVKANMSSVICELVKNAYNMRYMKNYEIKHEVDAKKGWERYDVSLMIPIFDDKEKMLYYNEYKSTMIVRLDKNDKRYLYDFINIKKGKCDPHG